MMHILSEFDPGERAQLADLLDRLVASIDDVVDTSRRPPTSPSTTTARQTGRRSPESIVDGSRTAG